VAITGAVAGRPRLSPVPDPEAGGMDELTVRARWMLQILGREPTPEELAAELDEEI
jgi:hypothetical protein